MANPKIKAISDSRTLDRSASRSKSRAPFLTNPSANRAWYWRGLLFLGTLSLILALGLLPNLFINLFINLDLAVAADIRDYFVKAPDSLAHGLTAVERRALLDITAQKQSLYVSPSESGFWVDVHGANALTLYGYHRSPIVFKTFDSKDRWRLLAICHSRQTSGPTEEIPLSQASPYDLTLMRVDHNDELNATIMGLYLPPISVLDFVTADTLTDRQAGRDLSLINQNYESCLTCHASVLDPRALDILTVTTINGHSCWGFLPQFNLLPLAWNGEYFTKPHDRAAPKEDRRPQPSPSERGPYYRPPAD